MKIAITDDSYSCGLINWWHLDTHILCFLFSCLISLGSRHCHDKHTRSSQACLICNIHTHCKAGMNAICQICHPPNPAQLTKRTIVNIVCNNWDHCVIVSFWMEKLLKKISHHIAPSFELLEWCSDHILQIWWIIL